MQSIRDAAFVAGNARNAHSALTLVNIVRNDVPHFSAVKNPLQAPIREIR